jgi:hypothetical protein
VNVLQEYLCWFCRSVEHPQHLPMLCFRFNYNWVCPVSGSNFCKCVVHGSNLRQGYVQSTLMTVCLLKFGDIPCSPQIARPQNRSRTLIFSRNMCISGPPRARLCDSFMKTSDMKFWTFPKSLWSTSHNRIPELLTLQL